MMFTSPYMSQENYVRLRALWAAIFVVLGLWDQIDLLPSHGIYYYFFLTHQTRLINSLGQITEWMAARSVSKGEVPSACVSKTSMLCFAIGQPLSLVVAFGYWLLIWPDLQSGKETVDWLAVYNHGGTTLLLIISFFIGHMSYNCSCGGWVVTYGALYLAWTYIHFLLPVGMFDDCEGHEDPKDCPIYEQFDWHDSRTPWLALLAVGLVPVVVLLYSGLCRLRDCCTENVEHKHVELLGDDMVSHGIENGENGNTELRTSTNTFESKKGEKQWPLQVPR